jgi:hypothetical protein
MTRKMIISICIFIFILALLALLPGGAQWQGVDKSVVEKFAEEAGHPSRQPLINTDRGDLLLFFFLLGGTAGGFVMGYYFRVLFPPGGGPKDV